MKVLLLAWLYKNVKNCYNSFKYFGMEWKAHQFGATLFRHTSQLAIISFQKYTQNPNTSTIFRIQQSLFISKTYR